MSIYTQMPPSLAAPWNFGSWDNSKSSTPPWSYRHFWYREWDSGTLGDTLVIDWRWGFDEGDYQIVCGDIWRCENIITAMCCFDDCRRQKDRSWGGGVFIFYATRRPGITCYGDSFPDLLPDNRWRSGMGESSICIRIREN